ncbi:titin, partial [Austrofundulus limnaeus]|uniref:Titin n=1 Tax=Austrofundulus limnaeus TaxID=52670 RepID=A0A2I4AHF0_AUSLI
MSEENLSLFELLNLSIGTAQKSSVNFSALHALLLAVLKKLEVLELKTQWRGLQPGHLEPHASVDVSARDRDPEEEEVLVDRASEKEEVLVDRASEEEEVLVDRASEEEEVPTDRDPEEEEVLTDTEADRQVQQRKGGSGGSDPDGEELLRSRIQTCEDVLSKAMELIKELREQKEAQKEKLEELHQQQESSLRETLQKYPDPEELSQRVTWALNESSPPQKPERTNDLDPVTSVEPAYDPPTGPPPLPPPLPDDHAITPAAPRSPDVSAQRVDDSVPYGSPSQVQHDPPRTPEPQTEGDKVPDPITAHLNLSQKAGGSAWNQETVRNLNNLQEKLSQVEARTAALEEQKVDQNQLAQLRELISNNTGWWDTQRGLRDQPDQQTDLIQSLKNDCEKNMALVNDVQMAILKLQVECEKLQETTRSLHKDSLLKQNHIEELFKTTEELDKRKADKQMVE